MNDLLEASVEVRNDECLKKLYDELKYAVEHNEEYRGIVEAIVKLESVERDRERNSIEHEKVELSKESAEREEILEQKRSFREILLKLAPLGLNVLFVAWQIILGYKFESNGRTYSSVTFKDVRGLFKKNPFR